MISIVITSFNRKHIIQRAIDSAILCCKSLEVDFELIIVDDNSSDNTKEFIYSNYTKEIESKLSEIFLFLVIAIRLCLCCPYTPIYTIVINREKTIEV